ncbi:LCP family protein [Brevibacillus nitrificans]|uniref:LCP family protein n=1 Tax=Brevibacillus nitrificans TaxID=651560 RepID=UPI0026059257|nr:LCP family protein [Brevibacillus nitrificans]
MPAKMEKPQPPSNQASKKKRRGRRSKKMYVLLLCCLFFCLVAAGAGYALSQWNKTLEVVTEDPYQLPDQPKVEQPYEEKESLSFVIVGLDTRQNIGMLNTDVLVVAVANPVTKKLTMVSLPRDTRVEIPGYPGYHKINEVFALGEEIKKRAESKGQTVTENGMTLLKKTLESMLGVSVAHYVQLDFEGFTAVIDKLGGVKVDVDKDLVYELPQEGVYRSLKKGTQVLNGEQALGFVRHRLDKRGSAYNSSDFDRNRRQQQVIKAVADKVASVDGISSLTAVLETVGKHIRTDLSKDQINGLAMDFGTISSERMTSLDNGAVWSSPYTLWPKENMEAIRTTLKAEMGSEKKGDLVKLSDAAVVEVAQAEIKNQPKPASKPAAAVQTASPATPAKEPDKKPNAMKPTTPANSDVDPTNPVPDGASDGSGNGQEGTEEQPYSPDMPPPDILAPPSPVESGEGASQGGV